MGHAVTLRPVTWEVREPITGHVLALIQVVHLGPRSEPYYRSVTPDPNPQERRLIGYWGSPDQAHDGTIALYEHRFNRSLAGGGLPPRELVPMKPPPMQDKPRPVEHVQRMAGGAGGVSRRP